MDAQLIATLAPSILSFFQSPTGPTATQVAAAAKAKHDAEVRNLVIGAGLVGAALLVYVVASRSAKTG